MKTPPNAEAWLKAHGNYLFSIAMMKTRDKTLSEDLVQETFLSAIKGYDNFQGNSSEKTWLTTILKNKIIDHYRKKNILKDANSYLTETDHAFYDHFFATDQDRNGHWLEAASPKGWEFPADHAIIEKEFNATLELCLSKLPAKLLPVFLARVLDEDDSENICKEFNLSASNYWVILHRAKLLMRACLEAKWLSR
jgi:RNA polymerase sigma-70 factor (TIGR02943 family)